MVRFSPSFRSYSSILWYGIDRKWMLSLHEIGFDDFISSSDFLFLPHMFPVIWPCSSVARPQHPMIKLKRLIHLRRNSIHLFYSIFRVQLAFLFLIPLFAYHDFPSHLKHTHNSTDAEEDWRGIGKKFHHGFVCVWNRRWKLKWELFVINSWANEKDKPTRAGGIRWCANKNAEALVVC